MGFLDTEQGENLFGQYLKKFKGKSSQRVYKSEIRQFFSFFVGNIDELTEADFQRYRQHLQGVTPGTIKRKFSIINGFLKFLEKKVPGFVSPLGKNYGHLQSFHSSDYADSEAFRDALNHWKATLITDSTRKTYCNHVKLFFQWVSKEPKELVQEDFIRYRDHLIKEEKRKPSTIWTKFISLNRFFKFMASRNIRFRHPMHFMELNLSKPNKDKGYYSVLTESEVRKLFRAPDRDTLIGKRDYAILRLMLGYGLRVNEICKLSWQDIDHERVRGKLRVWIRDRKGRIGKREDTAIILEGKVLEAFDDWINNCGIAFEPKTKIFAPFMYDLKEGNLVIDYSRVRSNKRRDNKTIQNMLKKYISKAGIIRDDRVLSPHALRHTALTALAKAGVDLVDLKKIAAHQDVSTTMIYLHSVQNFDDHVGMRNPINKY